MWLLVSAALALPPAPPPLALRAGEAELLAARGMIFRFDADGESIAALDVAAPPGEVMAAVMDLPPRTSEIGALQDLEIYGSGASWKAARWELEAMVYEATFHVRYEYDLAAGWCVYNLDTTRQNDLQRASGSYQVYAVPGGSRLVYRSIQASSIVPDALMERLGKEGARQLLEGIRARAER